MVNTVNERVKSLRNSLGMNQQEFATQLDVATMTVSRWEKGVTEINQKALNKMINTFGIDREWLINGVGELNISEASQNHSSTPWKDEAYNRLIEENQFLKNQIQVLNDLIRMMKPQANFLNGNDIAGLMFQQSFEA